MLCVYVACMKKINKSELYFANTEKIEDFLRALDIKRSHFSDYKVAGLGTRYLSALLNGKKSFPLNTFVELASFFNKQFNKQDNVEKNIDYRDLYILTENDKKKKKEKIVFLEKFDSWWGVHGFSYFDPILITRAKINRKISLLIEHFLKQIEDLSYIQDKFKNAQMFNLEEDLAKIRSEGEINSTIEELSNLGITMYEGFTQYPSICYKIKELKNENSPISTLNNERPNLELESFAFPVITTFLLFSDEDNVSRYNLIYDDLINIKDLDAFVKKNPFKKQIFYDDFTDPALTLGKRKGKLHEYCLDKLMSFYYNLEEDYYEQTKVLDLPFYWMGHKNIEVVKKLDENNVK